MLSLQRRKIAYLALIAAIVGLLTLKIYFFTFVEINGRTFIVRQVSSQSRLEKGLGGQKSLCQRCGMLFNFPAKAKLDFWMKDMQFDLDIIWISDGRIVAIEKDIPYDSEKTFSPGTEADKVLEINAGISEKFDFLVGDPVKIY